MKKTVVCVMFCAILLCAVSGCYSTVITANSEQTDEVEIVDSSEFSNEESIPDDITESEVVSLSTSSEPQNTNTSTSVATTPQQEEKPLVTVDQTNIPNIPESTNDTGDVKSQAEADWVCAQYYIAVQQNTTNINRTVHEFDTEIANLRNQVEHNSTQQLVELRQLRERYSNMGMLDSGAYQSAVKSVQKRYSDANMELGDRITKQQNQRDKYIKDHDNVEHVIYIMSDNMGLTYNEVSDLVLIYEDEINAYVANYPSK